MFNIIVHSVGKMNFKVKFLIILFVRFFVGHIQDVYDVHHESFLPVGLFLPHYRISAHCTFLELGKTLITLSNFDNSSDGFRVKSVFFKESFNFLPGMWVVLGTILVLDN